MTAFRDSCLKPEAYEYLYFWFCQDGSSLLSTVSDNSKCLRFMARQHGSRSLQVVTWPCWPYLTWPLRLKGHEESLDGLSSLLGSWPKSNPPSFSISSSYINFLKLSEVHGMNYPHLWVSIHYYSCQFYEWNSCYCKLGRGAYSTCLLPVYVLDYNWIQYTIVIKFDTSTFLLFHRIWYRYRQVITTFLRTVSECGPFSWRADNIPLVIKLNWN